MTAASAELQRANALQRRYRRYAAKFVNDSDTEPTDTELAAILASCVRRPQPGEYEYIRLEVAKLRAKRAASGPGALHVRSIAPTR